MTKLICAMVLAIGTLGAAPADRTFTGTVSDELCAANHAPMQMGPTDAECTVACHHGHGAAYVLVAGDAVYKLSDQDASGRHAGKQVKVTGTLDEATGTIQVTSIE
jgi:hypothetical protein